MACPSLNRRCTEISRHRDAALAHPDSFEAAPDGHPVLCRHFPPMSAEIDLADTLKPSFGTSSRVLPAVNPMTMRRQVACCRCGGRGQVGRDASVGHRLLGLPAGG